MTGSAPANRPHPIPAFTGVPEVRFVADLADQVTAFTASASAHGVSVRRAAGEEAIDALVGEVVATHDVTTAVHSRDPESRLAARALVRRGIRVLDFTGPAAAAEADLGVTGAAWGIAGTGSLLVEAERADGRSASLLPPVHLALVSATRIVRTPGDVWRRMAERYPAGPPSQMVLITGPSRSGDIEFVLTLGVHGPRAVWIGMLGAE